MVRRGGSEGRVGHDNDLKTVLIVRRFQCSLFINYFLQDSPFVDTAAIIPVVDRAIFIKSSILSLFAKGFFIFIFFVLCSTPSSL